jgi:putative addiction module component (TIGR02574 family)
MSQTVTQLVEATKALSIDEQLELFDALWELIDEHAVPDICELSAGQAAELDRRWEDHIRQPESAIGWEEGKSRLAALRDRQ